MNAIKMIFLDTVESMVVTWLTTNLTKNSMVYYGTDGLTQTVKAIPQKFTDGGLERRTMFIYRAHLTDLTPETRYRKQLLN